MPHNSVQSSATSPTELAIDTVIFGGGVAGLWLLDELIRRGSSAILLEAKSLGSGQTIASQGILHGGLKYTLQGLLTKSAIGIREMPAIWRNCLAGEQHPHLTDTTVRASHAYLWRTKSVTSRLGMIGAQIGLRVAPQTVAAKDRPPILADCAGSVAQLDEPIIAPHSLLTNFFTKHQSHIFRIDATQGVRFETTAPGQITAIQLDRPTPLSSKQQTKSPAQNCPAQIRIIPQQVIFTAGKGNEQLRTEAGLTTPAMQRRPLHMVQLRGPISTLPELNGHCVDGRKTRVTITSDIDSQNRRIWQIGGQIAEVGVEMTAEQLIRHTRTELQSVIPNLTIFNASPHKKTDREKKTDPQKIEWSSYRVDRAEGRTDKKHRPETVRILHEGNCITAWPTKLVLAPQLARNIADEICKTKTNRPTPLPALAHWPHPPVALPPWETATEWIDDQELHTQQNKTSAA